MASTEDTIRPLTSLPYHEPSMVIVLVLASFLLFVNFARVIAGRVIGAGLLGEILIGAVYAAPLASILPAHMQYSLQSLGYLGLMLLIVEGGLNTRLDILTQRWNAFLAVCTASVGIILPIGFSFALLPPALGFGWLESFACGAALASTSLGTVFSVIASTNSNMAIKVAQDSFQDPIVQLQAEERQHVSEPDHSAPSLADTRVGSILIGAALLDDIVGLVLSSVVTNLSSGQRGVFRKLAPWTAARPVVASICLLLVSALLARFIIAPFLKRYSHEATRLILCLQRYRHIAPWLRRFSLFFLIAVVAAFATIASYIGSSKLIGSFCAGSFSAYCWQVLETNNNLEDRLSPTDFAFISTLSPEMSLETTAPVGTYFLIPFFFASIGAAIPIKEMFVGSIVWKGFIYTGLMGAGKALAGVCMMVAGGLIKPSTSQKDSIAVSAAAIPVQLADLSTVQLSVSHQPVNPNSQQHNNASPTDNASWPAALFLGVCLVARGEIGFLIINLAYQGGLVGQEAFLVSVWAITLNTIIGPASVGIFLKTDIGRSIERGKLGRVERAM